MQTLKANQTWVLTGYMIQADCFSLPLHLFLDTYMGMVVEK